MIGLVKITQGSSTGWMHNVEDKVAMKLGKGGAIVNLKR